MTILVENDPHPEADDGSGSPTLDGSSVASLASDYFDYDFDGSCSRTVPRRGRCVIMRAAGTDRVLTLKDSRLVLAPPGLRGSFVWDCVETNGWLGFRSPTTGKFLGHLSGEPLTCATDHHKGWEQFMAPPAPDGNVYLVTSHWGRLCRITTRTEDGQEVLVRNLDGGAEGVTWEFFEFDR